MTSIIVLCWNHWKDLTKPLVDYMVAYHEKKDFQLILWNNGSSDETKDELIKLYKKYGWIRVGHSSTNLGFGKGNNEALEMVDGENVLFLNNDVLFPKDDWLTKIEELLTRHPDSLVGQEKVTGNSQTMHRSTLAQYMNGWCVALTKKSVQDLSEDGMLFDEDYGLAYFEDVDLSIRAQREKMNLIDIPLGLTHLGSKSSQDQLDGGLATSVARQHYEVKQSLLENQKRIVFFVPEVPYPFIDSDLEGKGVGGAESALIFLSRALAKMGWRVEIYNKTKTVGKFNGVHYYNIAQFRPHEYSDVFVLFRSYHPALQSAVSMNKLFWSCDQYTNYYGTWITQVFPYVHKVIAISNYHKKYLIDHYRIKEDRVVVINLGVQWKDYEVLPEKKEGKAIYCSVPMRGLDRLAKLCDRIKALYQPFNLVITSDYRLWGLKDPENEQFREMFKGKEYVTFLGKVSREELVKHQKESQVMAYPSNYDECFCISALECMASGAVPVTIGKGAIPTTVADGGIVLSTGASDEEYVQSIVRLFKNTGNREVLQNKGRTKAIKHDWDTIAHTWETLIDTLEKGLKEERMVQCPHCEVKVISDYTLQKHIAKRHTNSGADTKVSIEVDMPDKAVLLFKSPIEIGVNGKWFSGTQVEVPYEYVDTVIQIARETYGEDVVI